MWFVCVTSELTELQWATGGDNVMENTVTQKPVAVKTKMSMWTITVCDVNRFLDLEDIHSVLLRITESQKNLFLSRLQETSTGHL